MWTTNYLPEILGLGVNNQPKNVAVDLNLHLCNNTLSISVNDTIFMIS